MKSSNRTLPTLGIAFCLSLAVCSLNATAATPAAPATSAPAGKAPKATAPHDLRTQHLRLRTKCETQAASLGLQGEDLKVELHRCLQQGG
jgi:hypothetical protein